MKYCFKQKIIVEEAFTIKSRSILYLIQQNLRDIKKKSIYGRTKNIFIYTKLQSIKIDKIILNGQNLKRSEGQREINEPLSLDKQELNTNWIKTLD